MLRTIIITLVAISFAFTACQSGGSADGTDAGAQDSTGMAQFAEDEEFQGAHETPGEADAKNTGEMIEFPTSDGEAGTAYALMTENPTNEYLLVFHEWWGLNDHIRQEAERYFEELDSVNVLALDLYDGKVAQKQSEASQMMQAVKEDRIRAIIQGALDKAGPDARIATVGWCFGGGWSLKASIMAGEQGEACVMYYGMPVETEEALEPLEAPILAHFALLDDWVTPQIAKQFKELVSTSKKTMQLQMYNAKHAFANPSSPRYDQQAAQRANRVTMTFLKENLFPEPLQ